MEKRKKTLAIFASGTGSNAKKIIDRFKNSEKIKVGLVVSNNPAAGVLNIAAENNIPSLIIEKENFFRGDHYIKNLQKAGIDFIVLAGFLWKVPAAIISQYQQRIINIHPALLPKYGGKGMYGSHVHEAVLAAKEKESGITIHYVDDKYDHGQHILQVKCPVLPEDTIASLSNRIHELEYAYYPGIIEELLLKNFRETE